AFKACFQAHDEMAATAANGETGADVQLAVRRRHVNADDAPVLLDQTGRLCAHAQIESLIEPGMSGDEIEEIPLRHQRDEFAVHWQVFEVADNDAIFADLHGNLAYHRVRQLKEFVEQAELVHHLQR